MNSPDMAAGCAWVDGEYVAISDAKLPLTDVGFTRSDVTYDVVAVWQGYFFRLDEHLQRFSRSQNRLQMTSAKAQEDVREILFECVRRSGLRNAYVEMITTRGTPPSDGSRDPRRYTNRFYAFAIPYVWILNPSTQPGADLVVARGTTRIPTSSVDPTIKNFHWGDLTRAMMEAYSRGGTHAILLDADGFVTEGPGFNVFAVVDGKLLTPSSGVLEGITRRTIIELAEREGIQVEVSPLPESALHGADEVFVTSTAGGVMPARSIDGRQIGVGAAGTITEQLQALYWEAHTQSPWAVQVDY